MAILPAVTHGVMRTAAWYNMLTNTFGWRGTYTSLSYKMIAQAGVVFNTGMYEFAQMPFVYEIARRMLLRTLADSHLEAPGWMLGEWFFWFRLNITCGNPYASFYRHSRQPGSVGGRVTFNGVARRFEATTDVHLRAKLGRIRKGRWGGVPLVAWPPDVRVGSAPWGDNGTFVFSLSERSSVSDDVSMDNLDSPKAPFPVGILLSQTVVCPKRSI